MRAPTGRHFSTALHSRKHFTHPKKKKALCVLPKSVSLLLLTIYIKKKKKKGPHLRVA